MKQKGEIEVLVGVPGINCGQGAKSSYPRDVDVTVPESDCPEGTVSQH